MSVYGIDLGTTQTCIAKIDSEGRALIIPNKYDSTDTTASVVYFESSNNIVVGDSAKSSRIAYPDRVVSSIKTEMGTEFRVKIDNIDYSPEEISGFILKRAICAAEEEENVKIRDVVITVPAYFDMSAREATKKAAKLNNLNVITLISEPTAAIIAYEYEKKSKSKYTLVYDLGGGTFDVSVVQKLDGKIEVIEVDGNARLGGDEWDLKIAEYLIEKFEAKTKIKIDSLEKSEKEYIWFSILSDSEKLKKKLTNLQSGFVIITCGGKSERIDVSLEKFNELTLGLLNETMMLVRQVIKSVGKRNVIIDEVVLVGGSSKMKQVSDAIKKETRLTPVLFDPILAVAKGAAILGNKKMEIQDILTRSYGTNVFSESHDKRMISNILLKGTKIPFVREKRYLTLADFSEKIKIDIILNDSTDEMVDYSECMNKTIDSAELKLSGKNKKGSPLVTRFEIDESGTLKVFSRDEIDGFKVTTELQTKKYDLDILDINKRFGEISTKS